MRQTHLYKCNRLILGTRHSISSCLSKNDYPGRLSIESGHLLNFNKRTGRRIRVGDPVAWKSAVKVGSRISISVIVYTRGDFKTCHRTCPRCDGSDVENYIYHGWLRW